MLTKHFFKTLVVFMLMIIIGLVGVFLLSYFGGGDQTKILDNIGIMK